MPNTYTDKSVETEFIPPAIPGFVWVGNSDRPMWEFAIAEYSHYAPVPCMKAVRWEPGSRTRWAVYLNVK